MNQLPTRTVRVKAITWLAINVHSVILESLDGRALPSAEPGAHIDVRLTDQLTRSYSVVGNAGSPGRYEVAVTRDANSRGGSKFVHESLRVGSEIKISEPRNLFPLVDSASQSVLIAGGIGITPLWSMVRRLELSKRKWTLFYAARSRKHAAYIDAIKALASESSVGRLITHFDDEQDGSAPDLSALVTGVPHDAHLYCCGPQPMLAAFEEATSSRPSSQVHLERFGPAQSAAKPSTFQIILSKSKEVFTVPEGQSILEVLLQHSIDAQYGCMQGACGICEMKVLDGIPEHLDNLLSVEVKSSNQSILICCSRSKTPTLTLDA